ncbi:MAG: anthranilate phosphoribosyltransferase [Chloroflexi bacterium]|nr:anthranilate phosphoribosyltransferase [Chloroflexota bacterium]
MIKEAINGLVSGASLTFEQAAAAMEEIMSGEATPAQIAAFVTALRMKGETADEIAGMASVMRAKAVPVTATGPLVDTCGTGGDNCATFNISTAAAFVAAGAGLKVAKHGNRAMSSHCGSADVLEALGVKIDLGAEAMSQCLETAGIGFMFAPLFHPAMKHAAAPRREIGIRTVFNILGPLTNPARAQHQVIGVPDEGLGQKLASVLYRLATRHSLVVHSRDGLDELSISAPSLVWEVNQHGVSPPREVTPSDFGLETGSLGDVGGGAPEQNAAVIRRVLDGEKGPHRDVVVMNAAAAIFAADRASDFRAAARLAGESIDSGRAGEKLDRLVELSQTLR